MARPVKYDVNDIKNSLDEYIANTDDPMIVDFCVQYGISKGHLYELAKNDSALNDTIKMSCDKQERYIVKQTQSGNIPPAFGIFRLKQKQFGWTDKTEVVSENINLNKDVTTMTEEEIEAELAKLRQK